MQILVALNETRNEEYFLYYSMSVVDEHLIDFVVYFMTEVSLKNESTYYEEVKKGNQAFRKYKKIVVGPMKIVFG